MSSKKLLYFLASAAVTSAKNIYFDEMTKELAAVPAQFKLKLWGPLQAKYYITSQ